MYKGVETLVEEEDVQPITEPIIPPAEELKFALVEKEVPQTVFDFAFLGFLSTKPALIRNIAVCGHLHHGKTTFVDVLVKATHKSKTNNK